LTADILQAVAATHLIAGRLSMTQDSTTKALVSKTLKVPQAIEVDGKTDTTESPETQFYVGYLLVLFLNDTNDLRVSSF
jgi:hypothetical protein